MFHRCNDGCWFIVHTYLAFIVLNAITLFEVGRINSIQGYYKFGLLLQRLFFPENVKEKGRILRLNVLIAFESAVRLHTCYDCLLRTN